MDGGGEGPENEPLGKRNPSHIEAALARLPAEERTAIQLVHEEGYSREQAAAFLDLTPREFHRLLWRAYRHVIAEYERIERGLTVAFVFAFRAAARASRRTLDGLTGHGRVAGPLLDLVATSVAALVMATTTGLLGGNVDDEGASAARRVSTARARHENAAPPARPAASRGGADRTLAQPVARAPSRVVGIGIGPVREPKGVKREGAVYGLEADPPVPPPDEPRTGISPGPIGIGVGYHCPPPGKRPLVAFDVVCALNGE